jgi:hypothetical protein
MATDAGQAAGHPNRLAGANVGGQIAVPGSELGRRGRTVEAHGIGVNSLISENLALLTALGAERIKGREVRLLTAGVCHDLALFLR